MAQFYYVRPRAAGQLVLVPGLLGRSRQDILRRLAAGGMIGNGWLKNCGETSNDRSTRVILNVELSRVGRSQITSFHTIPMANWHGPFADVEASDAVRVLESGKVLYFPNLAFIPEESCDALYASNLAEKNIKNISYNSATGVVKGTAAADREQPLLQKMMEGFAAAAGQLVVDLFPRYAGSIERARASYRPVEIAGREYSPLRDDKLLHVDAFPSTPTRGRRILRLFSNINPWGKPRIWHVGEPFEVLAARFLPALGRPNAALPYLLAAVGATRGRRSGYDQLMLGLHDGAKRDAAYQANAPHQEFAFPARSSWICFTDQVVHAALAGQFALEQTFYLDIEAMTDPESSPLRVLERMTGRRLR